jgi:apolipoprotein N-acyltransferase
VRAYLPIGFIIWTEIAVVVIAAVRGAIVISVIILVVAVAVAAICEIERKLSVEWEWKIGSIENVEQTEREATDDF